MRQIAVGMMLATTVLLTGCQTPPPVPVVQEVQQSRYSESDIMLFEATKYRAMNAPELAAQAESLRKAYAARKNEENRLRFGIFLATVQPPQGDRARALALLDVPPSEVNGRGRTHPIAQLLIPLLQESRRLDEALRTTQQQLRDETARSDALQQTSDSLKKKLDAIRNIERRMLERNTRPQR